jgi:hypothetical protein
MTAGGSISRPSGGRLPALVPAMSQLRHSVMLPPIVAHPERGEDRLSMIFSENRFLLFGITL